MKKYHARCGLSKKQAKKLKIKHCYLMASVNKDGTIKSVQCYSDSNPTFMVGDTLVRIMETRGSSYQKAAQAMLHCLRINTRYRWALDWVNQQDYKTWENLPNLWKTAKNGEVHVKHCNLESKFLASLSAT